MKQAAARIKATTKNNKKNESFSTHISHRLREGLLLLLFGLAAFLILALLTYNQADPAWSRTTASRTISNAGGYVGAWFADVFLYGFGYLAYLFPVMLIYLSIVIFREQLTRLGADLRLFALRGVGFILVLLAGAGLASLELPATASWLPFSAGGILGHMVSTGLEKSFNAIGATILLAMLFLASVTLLTGFSWVAFLETVGRWTWQMGVLSQKMFVYLKQERLPQLLKFMKSLKRDESRYFGQAERPLIKKPLIAASPDKEKLALRKVPVITPKIEKIELSKRAIQEKQTNLFDISSDGSLPSLALLDAAEDSNKNDFSEKKLEFLSREVENRLAEFGVQAHVEAVYPGPVVTRFELQLAPGIKVSKISGLAKDIARSLSVISVRVVEVIPGKSVIGIELPNESREIVRLTEVLSSKQYEQARSPLSMGLGKDIAGHPIVVDIAKMPHLLVAGTTGSGKSVGLNAMLLSFLYKASPSELRMILIDPKMLELAVYDGIPHLLTPVVTDMKEAANSLRWCVAEMERRYRLMASLGVRNITGFNHKIREAEKKGAPILDPLWEPGPEELEAPPLATLPFILVLVDEFADMIMVVGKKVEELIARIAQKARAAGIHLVLATQRPSVDVITGLIKANIPSRISFQVSSKIDSRTILDQQGAEQLLGHGDMLYLPPGTSVPIRVHGAFVADNEVHKVVADWKKRSEPKYIDEIISGGSAGDSEGGDDGEGETDPLYDQVVEFVTETRKVSISSIQRRFKIGYNRSARIVDDLERAGVVSPMEKSGAREVLAPPPVAN